MQLDRQRARDPEARRRGGRRLLDDAGDLRQERPAGASRHGPGHDATHGRHHRRDRGMSELLAIAEAIVARAEGREQIEVYVSRGVENDVQAYSGEIESLTSATSAGVGIRLLLDG